MTGGTPGDGMGPAVALAGNLVALIDAVAGLRQAQAHAAQAAAARTAAEQLHAALTAVRTRVTRPGQTPARSARHVAATAEFPMPRPTFWLRQRLQTLLNSDLSRRWPSHRPGRGQLANTRHGLRPDRLSFAANSGRCDVAPPGRSS